MAKPTEEPRWATVPSTDPVSGDDNLIEPTSGKKDSGFVSEEKPTRQTFNWLLNALWKWKEYFETTTDDHETRITTNETDIASLAVDVNSLDSDDISNNSTVTGSDVTSALDNHEGRISTNETNIATNTSDIAGLTTDNIANNSVIPGIDVTAALDSLDADVNSNTSDISSLKSIMNDQDALPGSASGGTGTWTDTGSFSDARYKQFGTGANSLFLLNISTDGDVTLGPIDEIVIDISSITPGGGGLSFEFVQPCILLKDSTDYLSGKFNVDGSGFLRVSLLSGQIQTGNYFFSISLTAPVT